MFAGITMENCMMMYSGTMVMCREFAYVKN